MVPLAKTSDVIDQTLAIAQHPNCDLSMPVAVILNLSLAPESHSHIVRREVVEKMLEMCDHKQQKIDEQSSQSQQGEKEDPMKVYLLKYVYFSPIYTTVQSFSHTHTHTHTHTSPTHMHTIHTQS